MSHDFITFRCHYCNTKFVVGKYWVVNNSQIRCEKAGCNSIMTEHNLVNGNVEDQKTDVFGYESDSSKDDAYIRRSR